MMSISTEYSADTEMHSTDMNQSQDAENQEVQTETFKKRIGAAQGGGYFYMVKLLTLFYLRLQKTDKFYLASNIEEAHTFDDVVFKYEFMDKNGIPRSKTVFLQVKHIIFTKTIGLQNLLETKGEFSLRRYFDSYREIKKHFKLINGPIFSGEFDDSSFIIFTNLVLDSKQKLDNKDICNPDRWTNKEADIYVTSDRMQIRQLKVDAKINQDIIESISRHSIKLLARKIHDYTLGYKKQQCITLENEIFKEFHIFLANEVFSVNQYPLTSQLRNDIHKVESLWQELLKIENCSDKQLKEKLQVANVKLSADFGNHELKLEPQDFENMVTELASKIAISESNTIKYDNPINDITILANNVLVKGDLSEDGNELVKFREETLTGQVKEFMDRLKERLHKISPQKELDLQKIRFDIEGFPRFTLTPPIGIVTEVKQFLKNLEFAFGQASESELEGIIKEEIKSACSVNEDESNTIFDSVKTQVEKWWTYDSQFLTEKTKFVENARASISTSQFSFLNNLSKRDLEITGMQFNESALNGIRVIIEQLQVLNIVAETGTTLLSCSKVCQTLHQYWGGESYIFIQLKNLVNTQDQIFQTNDKRHFIVIENNNIYEKEFHSPTDFKKLYNKMYEFITKNKGKKVVLITEQDDMLASYFIHDTKIFHKQQDNINVNHLTIESQEKLMDNEVILHGKSIKMRDLVGIRNENVNSAITSQMIMSLIKNDSLIISNAPQCLIDDLDATYTKLYKKMPMQNLVEELRTSSGIFVISGIKKPHSGAIRDELIHVLQITDLDFVKTLEERIGFHDERNVDKNIIVINDAKEFDALNEFHQICRNRISKIIFWIEITAQHVRLQQVYEPNFYIERKFVYIEKIVLNIELILQESRASQFIFNYSADRTKVQKLVKNLHVEYQRQFTQNCENEIIIFAKSESEAEKLCGAKTNAHVLTICDNSTNQFICHCTHGLAADAKHNLDLESDLLIREDNHHTFIFCNEKDKQKALDLITKKWETKQQQFVDNCRNGIIRFSTADSENEIPDKYAVHFLKIDGDDIGQLVWEKSKGSLEQLREFIDEQKCKRKLYDETQFSKEIKDKVVLIADKPGMGKTTSLTSVSQRMLDENWVIRINLIDCKDTIEKLPDAKLTLEDVYNFASKMESTGLRNDFTKQLMLYKLDPNEYHFRPIIMMFDGYDELSSKQQEQIIPLLQYIKDQTAAKLWVTTMQYMMDALENGLSVFATKIEPLVLEEQKNLLDRFWRVRLTPLVKQKNVEEKIGIYSSKLLHEAAGIFGQTMSGIMGVPLQLRMLAEGLTRTVHRYLKGWDDKPPNFDSLNVLKLYQTFIYEKYEIYVREKIRIGKIIPSVRKILVSGFDEHHETSAMHLLFPNNDSLKDLKIIGDEEKDDLKSIGIIQSLGRQGNPEFIHRTFAEYFAAKYFAGCLKENKTKKKYKWTISFLMQHIFEERNNVIREFLDHMLSEGSPMHIATLAKKLGDVTELAKDVTYPKLVDNMGRTALHLAAHDGHINIVAVLLDNGYDALSPDASGKTPLHYAIKHKNVELMKTFLKHQCKFSH